MAIRAYKWEKAYDLARAHAAWLDVVLYHRRKFLQSTGREENIPKLQNLAQQLGAVDEVNHTT